MINQILLSLKHGTITLAQAEAEIQGLIELERVQLRDEYARAALSTFGPLTSGGLWSPSLVASHCFEIADAMLKARKS